MSRRDGFDVRKVIQLAENEARHRLLAELGAAATLDDDRLRHMVATSFEAVLEITKELGAGKGPNDEFWSHAAWVQRAEEVGRIAALGYQGKMESPDSERSIVSDRLLQVAYDEATKHVVRDFAFVLPLNTDRLWSVLHDAFTPVHVAFLADARHGNTFEAPHWNQAHWEGQARAAGKLAARKYLGDAD